MHDLLQMLLGGDLRSEGRAAEVARRTAEDPQLLHELAAGLESEDRLLRARTCMALEILSRDHAELVGTLGARLVALAGVETVAPGRRAGGAGKPYATLSVFFELDRVAAMIEQGTLRPGERVPSVRRLHRQWSVSVSTVLSAYRLLEDRGLIEARPQSGYYVRPEGARRLPEPGPWTHPTEVRDVNLTNLVVRLTTRSNRPDLVGLGCGAPDPTLLPVDALNRLWATIARRHADTHAYCVGPGHPRLRRAIAARTVDAGCALGPDDLVITSGTQEALSLCLQVVARPGETVIVESPTYFGLLEILQTHGLKALEVPSHPGTASTSRPSPAPSPANRSPPAPS